MQELRHQQEELLPPIQMQEIRHQQDLIQLKGTNQAKLSLNIQKIRIAYFKESKELSGFAKLTLKKFRNFTKWTKKHFNYYSYKN